MSALLKNPKPVEEGREEGSKLSYMADEICDVKTNKTNHGDNKRKEKVVKGILQIILSIESISV